MSAWLTGCQLAKAVTHSDDTPEFKLPPDHMSVSFTTLTEDNIQFKHITSPRCINVVKI